MIFLAGSVLAVTFSPDNSTYLRPEEKLLNAIQVAQLSYCCEKTVDGAWCQNNPQSRCDPTFRTNPSSCEATSFCKLGCCYDSIEGTCMENTPERVCTDNKGTWGDSAECNIPQCSLGCCVIADQAAFVTLARCKRLSSFYGLDLNFNKNIKDEMSCIALAQAKDEGACVYQDKEDYQVTCKFTTRGDCVKILGNSVASTKNINSTTGFHMGYLCSAEELGTNCGPSKKTTCLDKKDGVYYLDSCGNVANIYDSAKYDDKNYWAKVIDVKDSCNYGKTNSVSPGCGNCNYIQGSICAKYEQRRDSKAPTMGDNICRDLNCPATVTSDGKPHKHGESWCSGATATDMGNNPMTDLAGGRYFRHLCMQGEEIIEPCADFRQEICIDNLVGGFSEAGCRVNRWQDCLNQEALEDCENRDKRDCKWTEGSYTGLTIDQQNANPTGQATNESTEDEEEDGRTGICTPLHAPGLQFWSGSEATSVCAQANANCVVKYEINLEKTLFGKTETKTCVENCECEDEGAWMASFHELCVGLGDCGENINYVGRMGFVSQDVSKDGSPSVATGTNSGSLPIYSGSGSSFYSSSGKTASSGSSTTGGNGTV